MERNGELVAGLLDVNGVDGADGRCWICNAKGLL